METQFSSLTSNYPSLDKLLSCIEGLLLDNAILLPNDQSNANFSVEISLHLFVFFSSNTRNHRHIESLACNQKLLEIDNIRD